MSSVVAKPYKCPSCGDRFKTKKTKKKHQKRFCRSLGDTRPFKCQYTHCPKAYKTEWDRDQHEASHTKLIRHNCVSLPSGKIKCPCSHVERDHGGMLVHIQHFEKKQTKMLNMENKANQTGNRDGAYNLTIQTQKQQSSTETSMPDDNNNTNNNPDNQYNSNPSDNEKGVNSTNQPDLNNNNSNHANIEDCIKFGVESLHTQRTQNQQNLQSSISQGIDGILSNNNDENHNNILTSSHSKIKRKNLMSGFGGLGDLGGFGGYQSHNAFDTRNGQHSKIKDTRQRDYYQLNSLQNLNVHQPSNNGRKCGCCSHNHSNDLISPNDQNNNCNNYNNNHNILSKSQYTMNSNRTILQSRNYSKTNHNVGSRKTKLKKHKIQLSIHDTNNNNSSGNNTQVNPDTNQTKTQSQSITRTSSNDNNDNNNNNTNSNNQDNEHYPNQFDINEFKIDTNNHNQNSTTLQSGLGLQLNNNHQNNQQYNQQYKNKNSNSCDNVFDGEYQNDILPNNVTPFISLNEYDNNSDSNNFYCRGDTNISSNHKTKTKRMNNNKSSKMTQSQKPLKCKLPNLQRFGLNNQSLTNTNNYHTHDKNNIETELNTLYNHNTQQANRRGRGYHNHNNHNNIHLTDNNYINTSHTKTRLNSLISPSLKSSNTKSTIARKKRTFNQQNNHDNSASAEAPNNLAKPPAKKRKTNMTKTNNNDNDNLLSKNEIQQLIHGSSSDELTHNVPTANQIPLVVNLFNEDDIDEDDNEHETDNDTTSSIITRQTYSTTTTQSFHANDSDGANSIYRDYDNSNDNIENDNSQTQFNISSLNGQLEQRGIIHFEETQSRASTPPLSYGSQDASNENDQPNTTSPTTSSNLQAPQHAPIRPPRPSNENYQPITSPTTSSNLYPPQHAPIRPPTPPRHPRPFRRRSIGSRSSRRSGRSRPRSRRSSQSTQSRQSRLSNEPLNSSNRAINSSQPQQSSQLSNQSNPNMTDMLNLFNQVNNSGQNRPIVFHLGGTNFYNTGNNRYIGAHACGQRYNDNDANNTNDTNDTNNNNNTNDNNNNDFNDDDTVSTEYFENSFDSD